MSELVKLCLKYFQTKDFYEILSIENTANEKESMCNKINNLTK